MPAAPERAAPRKSPPPHPSGVWHDPVPTLRNPTIRAQGGHSCWDAAASSPAKPLCPRSGGGSTPRGWGSNPVSRLSPQTPELAEEISHTKCSGRDNRVLRPSPPLLTEGLGHQQHFRNALWLSAGSLWPFPKALLPTPTGTPFTVHSLLGSRFSHSSALRAGREPRALRSLSVLSLGPELRVTLPSHRRCWALVEA